jgi:hypothetical protein
MKRAAMHLYKEWLCHNTELLTYKKSSYAAIQNFPAIRNFREVRNLKSVQSYEFRVNEEKPRCFSKK